MDRLIDTKILSKETEESVGDKLRQKFSRSPAVIKNISKPKKKEARNDKKKKGFRHKSTKDKATSHSSPSDTKEISKLIYSTMLDNNDGESRSNNNDINNNFHYFIQQSLTNKCKCCNFCKEELNINRKSKMCKFCRIVCHEHCCSEIKEKCNNNQLLMLSDLLQLNEMNSKPDLNSKTSKSALISNNDPYEGHVSFNFYHGGLEKMTIHDSLMSMTSSSSMPLSLHHSYDFTTLDRECIKTYDIAVNSISEISTLLFVDKSHDNFNFNNSTYTCSLKSEIKDNNNICKLSYIYDEFSKEIKMISWNIKELKMKSMFFNKNNVGLNSELRSSDCETYVLGTIRIHINLLRPIKMELSSRPKSIYDVIGSKQPRNIYDFKSETIWLPRGSSKRLYITQSTSTIEVINCLLKKFYIKADPKKFGLYEHTIEGERKVSVRKLADIECPLALLLFWSTKDSKKLNKLMNIKRLVLQDYDTGDIEWSEFSIPELRNFLLILTREEEEISVKIQLRYSVLKNEVIRLRDLVLKRARFITIL